MILGIAAAMSCEKCPSAGEKPKHKLMSNDIETDFPEGNKLCYIIHDLI